VRGESHNVSAVAHYYTLPDTPYNLWLRDELAEQLRLPNDGTRVEVVGGEMVVSPRPTYDHNLIVQDVQRALFAAEMADPGFRWRCVHTMDLNLSEIRDGYIPDLIVLDVDTSDKAREAQARHLLPDQVRMVLEVTSRSNAADDRQPALSRSTGTKWNGYARVGLPYYLLVDRAPRSAQTVLYSDPDPASGGYLHFESWKFGETVRLPEPFGFEIVTDAWRPWDG
jgi:Putative restriction endonuclease